MNIFLEGKEPRQSLLSIDYQSYIKSIETKHINRPPLPAITLIASKKSRNCSNIDEGRI